MGQRPRAGPPARPGPRTWLAPGCWRWLGPTAGPTAPALGRAAGCAAYPPPGGRHGPVMPFGSENPLLHTRLRELHIKGGPPMIAGTSALHNDVAVPLPQQAHDIARLVNKH